MSADATARLAALIVTYHPDLARLADLLASLPPATPAVLVDNASTPGEVEALERLIAKRSNTYLYRNSENTGLAAALNRAAAEAARIDPANEFLVLLDQDSLPRAGAIESLLAALQRLETQGLPVGCVGPRLIDDSTGLQHGFHCIRGWRWSRVFPAADAVEPVDCANLNGSGTLLRRALFEHLRGLDADFFIDHVDTEWAFRVLADGKHLYGIPQVSFAHSMGERGLRFWFFGWRVWPQRSPLRHYYLFRNAVVLLRRAYVPGVWKFWATVKLALTAVVHGLVDPQRGAQLRKMGRALRDGWARGREGHERARVIK